MSSQETSDQREAAFVQPEFLEVAGLKLRRMTVGTLNLANRLGLTLFTDPEAAEKLSNLDLNRQILTIAWMQSREPKHVLNAVANGEWEQEVDLFAFGIDLTELEPLMQAINQLSQMIGAAAVETEEKPVASGKGQPEKPGN